MVGSVLCQSLLERFNGDVISIFDRSESDLMSVKGLGKQTTDKILKIGTYILKDDD